MKESYSKEEIARILRERPDIFRLMQLIISQPEDQREAMIDKALEIIDRAESEGHIERQ